MECEYCTSTKCPSEWHEHNEEEIPVYFRFNLIKDVYADGHFEWKLHSSYNNFDSYMSIYTPIEYCPKCGRKLERENSDG